MVDAGEWYALETGKLEKEGKGCQFWLLSKYRLRQARGRETANDLNALVQLVLSLTGEKHFQNIWGQYEEIPEGSPRCNRVAA